MLELTPTTKFKKDLKKFKHQIKIIKELNVILGLLVNKLPLQQKYLDHRLSGNWHGSRECHIAPDILLIYRIEGKRLFLERLGSHAELF